jgi:hypothetical protein
MADDPNVISVRTAVELQGFQQGIPAAADLVETELQPDEDLLAAFARQHDMGRYEAEVYFQAVAHGVGVEHARILAAPTAGAVQ